MTSAPVKDVGSLMNYPGVRGLTAAGNTGPTGSFGDVMSKASGDGRNGGSDNRIQPPREAGRTQVRDTSSGRRDTVRTEDSTAGQRTVQDRDQAALAAQKAGRELTGKIADQLHMSQEEVAEAMEKLGMSFYSLFDPASLTELVMTLTGEQDSLALLTDEGLFADLQQLLQLAQSTKDNLMQQLNMTPEEMQALLQQLASQNPETREEIPVQPPEENLDQPMEQNAEEQPLLKDQATITVKRGGETVTMTADENGNETGKVLEVQDQTETLPKHRDQKENDFRQKGEEKQETLQTGNPLTAAAFQEKGQPFQVSLEQTQTLGGQDAREIMDQILNYMKIQLRPGMDQLEMQLHPASLGTVHVQITSKGGEVTALFHVQNETVKAAMESQMAELKENLRDQGVRVEAVEVSVESHGFESSLWQGQSREENASSGNGGRRTPRRINLKELDEFFEQEAEPEDVLAAKMMEANGNTVDFTA